MTGANEAPPMTELAVAATRAAPASCPDLKPALQRAFETGNAWFAAGRTLFERVGPTTSIGDLVETLLYHNLQVWHYEDQGRSADDGGIVAAWRGGMAHNKERNVAINAIDALFVPHYRPGAEVHSESIGSIVDRLTILFLKWKNYQLRCERTAAAIAGHIDELIACLCTLQQRIERGEVRCLRLPRIKLYLDESSLTESLDPTRR